MLTVALKQKYGIQTQQQEDDKHALFAEADLHEERANLEPI